MPSTTDEKNIAKLSAAILDNDLNLFAEIILAQKNDCDSSYHGEYDALKSLKDTDAKSAAILFPKLNEVIGFDDFRSVGAVELANQLYSDEKLTLHPAENYLHILKSWINYKDEDKSSYAITACATLSLLTSTAALQLLKEATKHKNIMVKLEAIFSQVIHEIPQAKEKLLEMCLQPEIASKACDYAEELGIEEEIPETDDEEFEILSAAANWLSHAREYGEPPTKIEFRGVRIYKYDDGEEAEIYLIKYWYGASDQPIMAEYDGSMVLEDSAGSDNKNRAPTQRAMTEEYVQKLLDKGVPIKVLDKSDYTQIHTAVEEPDNVDMLYGVLEEAVEDMDAKCKNGGYTSLMMAAAKQDVMAMRMLMDFGAELDTQDDDGKTALHHAVKLELFAAAELLLAYGCDVSIKDNTDKTPLCLTATIDNKKIAELLQEY